MSALDNIIKRAKQGSSGSTPSRLLSSNKSKKIEDEDDYKTIVDKPSSTYALTPYKSTKSIPSTFTNDFERIYQVVKSSYNCGQVQYNYGTCYYDNLVQNYVQKGEAIVSSMQGYSNVSLQDLPLACNIPSVVYQNCSTPTNMLTTEITVNKPAGFRLNMNGLYLYPADNNNTVLTFIDRNSLQISRATFVLEKKSIDELERLITQDKPYYEKYNQYKNAYREQNKKGYFLNNFYYIKHVASGKYLVPSYTAKYTKASIIDISSVKFNGIEQSTFILRIYDENLDEILAVNNTRNILNNRTGVDVSNITLTSSASLKIKIQFYDKTINIGDIKISAVNSPNSFYSFSGQITGQFLFGFDSVTTIQNSIPSSLQLQDIGVRLGELNPYYSKVLGEYYYGEKFENSNTYPILFPFTIDDIYMLKNNNTQLNLTKWEIWTKWWGPEGYIGNSIPFFIENNETLNLNVIEDFNRLSYDSNHFKLLSSNDTKNIIIYASNFHDTSFVQPKDWFYLSRDFGSTFSTMTLQKNIQIIDLSKDGKYAIIAFTDNSVIYYNLSNLVLEPTNLGTFNYDNTKPYSICQSYDGNVIYLCFDNKKLWRCFNRTVWTQLSDIPYRLTKALWEYYHPNVNFMDTNQTGKNIMYKCMYRPVRISRDYGSNFDDILDLNYVGLNANNTKLYDDDFYLSAGNNLYKLNSNNKFQSIFTDVSSWNSYIYIMNITNTYVCFFVISPLQFSLYLLNKKSNVSSRINLLSNLSGINDYSYFINENLSSIIVSANKMIKINTDIPEFLKDTPYTLNNGLCYPSYSFTTSIISTQGVKNVFNANTFVRSTDTTIIKKIFNNLSITSSSILKNNTPIYSTSGSIRDIACSQNGQVIIAAVYNGKLLVSTNYGTNFTEYDESGRLTGNTSSSSISNIIRYWTSVACSFSGKYMSACAYNGNIFISTNNGTLFTSLPENFAKKWVQIVMSKSSDDTKDGIIQLACAEDGLFISYNRGANWSQISNEVIDNALGTGTNLKWSSVAISDSGQYMLATVYGGNVYASYNYGYDWSIYGVSRKECYEPVTFPTNDNSLTYLGYNVSASTTLSGTNIRNAFVDNNDFWSPTNSNSSVIINLPYKFILTDINIVNLTSVDVKILVEGSNNSSWNNPPLGENLNLYSTVDTNTSYSSFRLTFSFSSSNIQIQRIKLLGKTDFISGGDMFQIGNWKSCAIVSETLHYAASDSDYSSVSKAGLYQSVVSSSFGKVINIVSNTDLSVNIYDKNNNIITPVSAPYSNSLKIISLSSNTDIGRIEFPSVIPKTLFIVNNNDVIYNSGILTNQRNLYPPISPNKMLLLQIKNHSHVSSYGGNTIFNTIDNNFDSLYNPYPVSKSPLWVYFDILGASPTSLVYLTKFKIKFYVGPQNVSNTLSIYSEGSNIPTDFIDEYKNVTLLPDKKIYEEQFTGVNQPPTGPDPNIITIERDIIPPVPVYQLLVQFSRTTYIWEIQFFSM